MSKTNMNRRELLKLGAAGVAGAGLYKGLEALGLSGLAGARDARDSGAFAGIKEPLGKYIYLTPQKLGGGTHAVDLESMKTLAWISYWNYGDACPISHHLAAFPPDSGDPYKGFEFVNSTQGGDNVLIYGLQTRIKEYGLLDRYGQGNHIYRVGYDGKTGQMELLEDISETTGIGCGVHTVIYPDGTGFACADGQKDVAGFFTRARGQEKTKVQMAYRADWVPNAPNLGDTWLKGGTLRLTRLEAAKETGKYDLQGTRGNKINWEMAPMAELLVERGQIPGDSPATLTGLDNVVHDPAGRWSIMTTRMCGGVIVLDRKNWEPVCYLYACGSGISNLPVKKVSGNPDTWEIKLVEVANPVHEAGFNPSGTDFVVMNNLRANNVAVFDVSDKDPRNWKRKTNVTDPEWKGEYPSPFHVCFSSDGAKCFFTVLHPKPGKSDVVVADTKTWKIIKKFRGVGVDTQTLHVTYDGKFVLVIFSGFQRLEAGAFVFRQDTLEPVGYMPNFGGHHDCVIVPSKVEELKWSRCCTV
jgi:hypothetical protein